MQTRGRKTPLTVSEAATVLMIALGGAIILVAELAKVDSIATYAGFAILVIGVVLLSYRILRGRPTDPDGSEKPPTET